MRTLLFDIDGTLLSIRRAGAAAFAEAMLEEFGIGDLPIDQIHFGGRTDRSLMNEILSIAHVEATDANRDRLKKRYTAILKNKLPSSEGTVLPGVTELLKTLERISSISMGVMTGNFAETAHLKLDSFRLREFFQWIVGGDFDVGRCDLARRALAYLTRQHGQEACGDVIVIGDTPADIECAKAIGARCLAVCTGTASRMQLSKAGPDQIVDDLTDVSALDYLAR